MVGNVLNMVHSEDAVPRNYVHCAKAVTSQVHCSLNVRIHVLASETHGYVKSRRG